MASYLKLLKAIAKGEAGAEKFLLKWAETTKDKDVEQTLRFVAMREGEHGYAFRKRVLEISDEALPDQPGQNDAMKIAGDTSMTDLQKFEHFQLNTAPAKDKPDLFTKMFDNKDIDPVTGGLLGRYIAEERDSGRHFFEAYQKLLAKNPQPASAPAPASAGTGGANLVAELERLSKLHIDGSINEEEFKAAKTTMLSSKM